MEHFYHKIPGWFSFRAVYERAVREAPPGALFVEVGAWKGRSAAFMAVELLNSGKPFKFDCVDHWLGSDNPKHTADPDVRAGTLYSTFLKNIAPVRSAINVVRLPSVEAAKLYPAECVYFCFIDAAHDYHSVRDDIAAWWPKVKAGGVLAGDDFLGKGVSKAVKEMFTDLEIGTGRHWKIKKSAGV